MATLSSSLIVAAFAASNALDVRTSHAYPFNTSTHYVPSDIKYEWDLQVSTSFSCIWGANMPGIGMYASVLSLPPCTWIAPHVHPGTTEMNMVIHGKLNGTLFPMAQGAEPIAAQTQLGDLQVVPQNIVHLLSNDQCEDLAITHFFPSILDANFYSLWGALQETPPAYRNAVLPNGAQVLDGVNIPTSSKGFNQPIKQCMERCGMTMQDFDRYACPKKMPLKSETFDPIVRPADLDLVQGKLPPNNVGTQKVISEAPLNTPFRKYSSDDLNFETQLLKSTRFECLYGNAVLGEGVRHAVQILAPCSAVATHWHPTTDEINVVLQSKLNYTLSFVKGNGHDPISDQVEAGNMMLVPKGIPHTLFNDQCEDVAFMHVFPTATNEDLASIWHILRQAPQRYMRDAFPNSSHVLDSLKLVDGDSTPMPECMQRCGITNAYHDQFVCPQKMPIKAGGAFKRIFDPSVSKVRLESHKQSSLRGSRVTV